MSDNCKPYPLNKAVSCYLEGEHASHEGFYALAGQTVSWTDADEAPKPAPPRPAPVAKFNKPRTAMEEAFDRARGRS